MFLGMSLELWFITTILPATLMVVVWVWSRFFLRRLDEQIEREKRGSTSRR
jgi:hypothetical protein